MKKNILLLGDYIVDEFLEDLCEINSEYKVSHIYVLNITPEQEKIINNNKIEVIKGWHDFTSLIHEDFNTDILSDPNLKEQAFNVIKSFYRFSDSHDFFYQEAVYYELINYWIHFFEKNKIDLIITGNAVYFEQITRFIAEKVFGIRVITRKLLAKQPKNNSYRMYFFDSIKERAIPLYCEKEFKLKSVLYPNYSKLKIKGYPRLLTTTLKELFNFRFFNIFFILSNLFYFINLKKHFKKITVSPTLEKNFIYYPLHFDPEVMTMPEEDIRANQILNVKKLASALPKNWLIYVKPHPFQTNFKLNFWAWEFYGNVMRYYNSVESLKYLSKIDNVKIINKSTDQKKLIECAKAVATVSGTAFLEASHLNKMLLVFGKKTIFNQFSNAFHIESKEGIKRAINQLQKKDFYKSNAELVIQDFTYDSKIFSKKEVLKKLLSFLKKS